MGPGVRKSCFLFFGHPVGYRLQAVSGVSSGGHEAEFGQAECSASGMSQDAMPPHLIYHKFAMPYA